MATVTPDPPQATGPLVRVAARIGLDDGQAWSVVVVAAISGLLVLLGLPGVLTYEPTASAGSVLGEPVDAPVAAAPSATPSGAPSVAPDDAPSAPGAPGSGADVPPPVPPSTTTDAPVPPPPVAPEPTSDGVEGTGSLVTVPLSIVAGGTVSATSGVQDLRPDTDVTEEGVSVEARAGAHAARSFVRLAGTAEVLRLRLVNDPTASFLDATADVALCKVLETGWTVEPGTAVGEGPEYDDQDCVVGGRAASGTWSWDLSGRDDITDAAGWAMVPRASGLDTWRVTFAERGLQAGGESDGSDDPAAARAPVQPAGSDEDTRNPTLPALVRGVLADRADTRYRVQYES